MKIYEGKSGYEQIIHVMLLHVNNYVYTISIQKNKKKEAYLFTADKKPLEFCTLTDVRLNRMRKNNIIELLQKN